MTKWQEKEWPYPVGAVIISVINIFLLVYIGKPWGITSTLTHGGGRLLHLFGSNVQEWVYFQDSWMTDFIYNELLWLTIAIVIGSLLSSLLAGQFRIRKIPSKKLLFMGIVGGLLMGIGSRLAPHCNIGAVISGIPSLSLQGWVFAIFTGVGAFIGSKILWSLFD